MAVTKNDSSAAVKDLQRLLNKLGSMLVVDGKFGTSTDAAVVDARAALNLPPGSGADDALLAQLRGLPEPSAELTASGVTFIGIEEVSSPALYRQKYKLPDWPGADSGITIGIGYDLKFVDRSGLQADWGGLLDPGTIDRLAGVAGRTGSEALCDQVKDIEVPLPAAVRVYLKRTLPKHVAATRQAYPTLDTLPANRRTALISLVLNRGGSLQDEPGDSSQRRREMRQIRQLLDAGELEAVAEQFDSMARLWDRTSRGLVERRHREANLWRNGFAALQLA